jgi:hypothetical protein
MCAGQQKEGSGKSMDEMAAAETETEKEKEKETETEPEPEPEQPERLSNGSPTAPKQDPPPSPPPAPPPPPPAPPPAAPAPSVSTLVPRAGKRSGTDLGPVYGQFFRAMGAGILSLSAVCGLGGYAAMAFIDTYLNTWMADPVGQSDPAVKLRYMVVYGCGAIAHVVLCQLQSQLFLEGTVRFQRLSSRLSDGSLAALWRLSGGSLTAL